MRVWGIVLVLGVVGCGGSDDGGELSTGGTGGVGGGSGGSAGASTGGAGGLGTGGAAGAGTGGAAGAGTGGAAGGGACPTQASAVAGNHIVVEISWPATTGLAAGSGQMHIWSRTAMTFSGNAVTGTVTACGSVIPALTKSALAGGGQVQTLFPDLVWDSASMPTFQAAGSISGFDPGATVSMDPVVTLIGTRLGDPQNDAWPARGDQLTPVDDDGDGKAGITAVPRTDSGFSAPPLDLLGALNPNAPRADQVYIASRTVVQLAGTRTSCTEAQGAAQVYRIDSHVVGCHVLNGGECTAAQAGFIDDNQPRFTIGTATYTMRQVDANATCADVRAALPM